MNWTSDRTELLKKLWDDGLSASMIAAELGDTSRNSVIGKVRRLDLARRGSPANPGANSTRKPRKPKPSRDQHQPFRLAPALPPIPLIEAPPTIPDESARCSILDLEFSKCRWPVGDPSSPDFFFCGGKTIEGLPYCGYHSRIAYQPARERRAG